MRKSVSAGPSLFYMISETCRAIYEVIGSAYMKVSISTYIRHLPKVSSQK